ncbi:hypothetical protein V7S43_017144 [Phytophthora oleae]|uniref:Uncharacterized protein n=1 Tax=Phytophthora oleae TaxID=2107226 RepID=A0ABD3EXS7_9STRA
MAFTATERRRLAEKFIMLKRRRLENRAEVAESIVGSLVGSKADAGTTAPSGGVGSIGLELNAFSD